MKSVFAERTTRHGTKAKNPNTKNTGEGGELAFRGLMGSHTCAGLISHHDKTWLRGRKRKHIIHRGGNWRLLWYIH
jgi:hypothetical protein